MKIKLLKSQKKFLFKNPKQNNTYLKAHSWIYSNPKPYLRSSISIAGIKNLFLLAIFDYLRQEINFDQFLYIANELYAGIGPGFDLQTED